MLRIRYHDTATPFDPWIIVSYGLSDVTEQKSPRETDAADDKLLLIRSRHCRILVVDDEDMFRESLVLRLQSLYGAITESAENGMIALEIIDNKSVFDIIFMDFSMPEMNGIETYLAMREMGVRAQVILMSGERANSAKAKEFGLHFVVKPLKSEAIEEVLLRCRGGKES